MSIVTPKQISGFPEWLPQEKILEEEFLRVIRRNFELFGFTPIETSAVERVEVLTAKGGADKEIYALTRLFAEEGKNPKELALHFDLTVPLARYIAQNYQKLAFPFRRYQIQKVWRGERAQAGRYREFCQCDIDIVGDGELEPLADAEVLSVVHRIFKELNIGAFAIKLNNRKILLGYLEYLGISAKESPVVLRTIDKLEKIGSQKVLGELVETLGLSVKNAENLLSFLRTSGADTETMDRLRAMDVNERFKEGVAELEEVLGYMRMLGVPQERFQVRVDIVRGLDYYTGTVFETTLASSPGIGSICSGGRYDDLASHFTSKRLPGVGASIGITRLLSHLFEARLVTPTVATPTKVLVTAMDTAFMKEYLEIAAALREKGINTEVFLGTGKIGVQLKYADKKKIPLALIAGSKEFATQTVKLKNMQTGEERIMSIENITHEAQKEINSRREKQAT